MRFFGLNDRWAYRDEASGNCFGLSEEKIKKVCASADVFVNISCSTYMRDEYISIPARVIIDSDPMFTQIQYLSQQMFTPGKPQLKDLVDAHNYHFTFGENIGGKDCKVPTCGLRWLPTRQPIALKYWDFKSGGKSSGSFTTIMNWAAGNLLFFDGEEWGQKDLEFERFLRIPSEYTKAKFSIVVNQTGGTKQNFAASGIKAFGWKVLNPDEHAGDWMQYQNYINNAFGEFSVAKHTYVKAKTGWFSCRSACFLAAGRPVVTQDTGWSSFIPSGGGVFAFQNVEMAISAFEQIISDYKKQCCLAREQAELYFDSNIVLSQLLSQL
jgi:hypothetical protein